MQKKYTSLGLMSGTSGDGVDASIIKSNGIDNYLPVKDKFYEYDSALNKGIHNLKEKIINKNDIRKYGEEINELERKITIFHAKIIKDFQINDNNIIVGFHGQTIYHNPNEGISKQIGDGNLLNQLTRKKVICNFRENDIINSGQGAPLTPIFHQLLALTKKIEIPVCILNIGGISNVTLINDYFDQSEIFSRDLGPGNCLIDNWMRKNSNNKFDSDSSYAFRGEKNEIILEQAQELYSNRINKNKLSFDVNDFDISFARGLSLEDGARTLTDFTASIIGESLTNFLTKFRKKRVKDVLVCGGGRKNILLIKKIQEYIHPETGLQKIDDLEIDGDFIESQAFAYLAIRSFIGLPITFPSTTGCKEPSIGGKIILN